MSEGRGQLVLLNDPDFPVAILKVLLKQRAQRARGEYQLRRRGDCQIRPFARVRRRLNSSS